MGAPAGRAILTTGTGACDTVCTMTSSTVEDPAVQSLVERVLAMSTRLHPAIARFDEPGARYEVSGPPGLAFFQRDDGDTITHVSGSPAPTVMPLLDELRARHARGAGMADGV